MVTYFDAIRDKEYEYRRILKSDVEMKVPVILSVNFPMSETLCEKKHK